MAIVNEDDMSFEELRSALRAGVPAEINDNGVPQASDRPGLPLGGVLRVTSSSITVTEDRDWPTARSGFSLRVRPETTAVCVGI